MTPSAPPSGRFKIFSWTLFDFANTAFYVLILTVGYPLYFKKVIVGTADGDALWGVSFSISMLIVAVLSPILGAVADYGAGKKRFLWLFTLLCVLATAALFFAQESMILFGMIFLIFANIGFEAGLVFYDAFLPEITTERSYGRVSGYGFAMGYVGSLVTLLIAMPLYADGFEAGNLLSIRISFLIAAGLFLLFALPLFIVVPDPQRHASLKLDFVTIGVHRIRSTFKEFPKYRNVAKFLLAYFIYVDAINTIIIFSSIFADETLKLGVQDIIIFFAIVQTSGVVGSVLFGILADKIGHKKTLVISLVLWLVVVAASYFVSTAAMFFVVGIFAGIALGSSQSSSRSLMSSIIPKEKKTEFFGFYSFFGKASAILGPALFGVVSSYANQRIALVSVGVLLMLGLILLNRVDDHLAVPAES